MRELQKSGDTLIFVGDGVNDAPVLALAGVGVAMGGIGSDAAVEASDLVLLKDDLRSLPKAIHISRKTMGRGQAEHCVCPGGEVCCAAFEYFWHRHDVAGGICRRWRGSSGDFKCHQSRTLTASG